MLAWGRYQPPMPLCCAKNAMARFSTAEVPENERFDQWRARYPNVSIDVAAAGDARLFLHLGLGFGSFNSGIEAVDQHLADFVGSLTGLGQRDVNG